MLYFFKFADFFFIQEKKIKTWRNENVFGINKENFLIGYFA